MVNKSKLDIERANLFAGLYKHEDQLIWTKVKFIFTFTSILIAAWAFAFENNNYFPDFVTRTLIPTAGLISSLLFFVTIYNGQAYLRSHAKEWRKIMYIESDINQPLAGFRHLPTSRIILLICAIAIIFWFVLLLFPKVLTSI